MTDIAVVYAAQNELGEGPLWLADEQQLFWLDMRQGIIWRYAVATGAVASFALGLFVSAIAPRQAGGFVVATQHGFATWQPGQPLSWLVDPESHLPANRFNDGAVDSHGRMWAATLTDGDDQTTVPHGSLYRLDPDGQAQGMDTGFYVSNGLGWSPDNRTMYFTDSWQRIIFAYDFDAASGQISHRRPFILVPEGKGLPDGLAIDAEGYLWSACWGGGRIIRYAPDGQVEREIALPVSYPTSCAFGGPDLTTLYITSAWTALTPEQRQAEPLAGAVLRLHAPCPGLPTLPYAG
ncbi:MAG: SMP-30/gluconolactonase/LRE family protein [Ktedonobacterales bacterium]|nr:SMP-30/gluconolactonase/LRE family protein [Ktedonobacterales bacterium]